LPASFPVKIIYRIVSSSAYSPCHSTYTIQVCSCHWKLSSHRPRAMHKNICRPPGAMWTRNKV